MPKLTEEEITLTRMELKSAMSRVLIRKLAKVRQKIQHQK